MDVISHHLASGEEPGNSWILGESGELFQLDFAGSLPTASGYMCLLTPQEQSESTQEASIQVADWQQMKAHIDDSPRKAANHPVGGPFETPKAINHPSEDGKTLQATIAGQVLFAGGVDVYTKRKKKSSAATGVTIYGSESM